MSHGLPFPQWNICSLCPALSQCSMKVLVNALVTSHTDYCNAILAGIPNKLIHQLQITHDSAAWIITHAKSTEHVTPLLIQLHWLPGSKLINRKILFLTFKAPHNLSPAYLTECLQTYTHCFFQGFLSAGLLALPAINLSAKGIRAFSCCTQILELISLHIQIFNFIEFKTGPTDHFLKLAYSL